MEKTEKDVDFSSGQLVPPEEYETRPHDECLVELHSALRSARQHSTYLSLTEIATAIKEELGEEAALVGEALIAPKKETNP